MQKSLTKLFFSLPIILVVFYYIPFLGIVMLIARRGIIGKSKYPMGIVFIAITTVIVIPKFIHYICDLFKINQLSFIEDILSSDIYPVLLSRAKLLFILGIIALLINMVINKVKMNTLNGFMSYINSMQEQDRKIASENDLIMREKQERAKNTHFVHCPHCGADNHFSGDTGKCRYCKRTIEYKE